ncbi:MAG: BtpA/SgcQ family protein [Bacillota bacterium]
MGKIFPEKENILEKIYGVEKPILGMIHLKPLPGAPHFDGGSLDEVIEFALKEVEAFVKGGVDGLVIENAWDIPFSRPENIGHETSAAMAYVSKPIKEESGLPIGINVLANGAIPGLAVAKAVGAEFVRVNQWVNAYVANEGILNGASAEAMRYRSAIKADEVKIFADVHVKHGSHSIVADRSVAEQTRDNIFFDADVLIATGNRTGDAAEVDEIKAIKSNTDLSVITGSGLTADNVPQILEWADGSIVGSWLKKDGLWWNPVDYDRVAGLMEEVNKVRENL